MTSEDQIRRLVNTRLDCGGQWVGRRSGGLLVPRVTTVVLGGAVRSHFNTDLNAGGVTPVF